MKKSTINFIIDAIMLLCLCAITGIGLLIKYILPAGQDRWAIYGSNQPMQWLNMDRHQWGDIHFIISLLMIALLVVHVILHWSFITCIFSRFIKAQPLKRTLGWSFGLIGLFLIIFPFLVTPSQSIHKSIERTSNVETHRATHTSVQQSTNAHTEKEYDINGKMTLNDVAKNYQVSLRFLKKQLQLPEHVNSRTRLGHLRRQYGFRMSDIEKAISAYHN